MARQLLQQLSWPSPWSEQNDEIELGSGFGFVNSGAAVPALLHRCAELGATRWAVKFTRRQRSKIELESNTELWELAELIGALPDDSATPCLHRAKVLLDEESSELGLYAARDWWDPEADSTDWLSRQEAHDYIRSLMASRMASLDPTAARQEAEAIREPLWQTRVWASLCETTTDHRAPAEAIAAALRIQVPARRLAALGYLAQFLQNHPPECLSDATTHLLAYLEIRPRAESLPALFCASPILARRGGPGTADGLFQAVVRATRWWP